MKAEQKGRITFLDLLAMMHDFDAYQVMVGHLPEIMHKYHYFRNGSLTKLRDWIKRTLLNSLLLLKYQKNPN